MFQDANPPFLFSLPNMHTPFCHPSRTPRIFMFTTAIATLDNDLCRNAVASRARRSNSVQSLQPSKDGREGRVPCLTRMEFSGSVGQEHHLQSIDIDPPRGKVHPVSSVITRWDLDELHSAILAAFTLARGGYGTPSCRLEDSVDDSSCFLSEYSSSSGLGQVHDVYHAACPLLQSSRPTPQVTRIVRV